MGPLAVSVGDEIKAVTSLGDEVKGVVYCEDGVTGTLVLRAAHSHTRVTCDLRMLNRADVKSVEVLRKAEERSKDEEGSDLGAQSALMAVSEADLAKKEQKALAAAERAWAQINKKATAEGQEIFDALARTSQCEWDGQSIVVYDQVRIDPPYTTDDCHLLDGNKIALERVKKVLANERERLAAKKKGDLKD